jgi:ribosomal-protein-alanine N-acetyltransferase
MDEAPAGKRADAGRVPLVADRAGRPSPREGEEAAGFAVTRQILDEAELLLFAISPQYRRRGLGGILLKNLLEESEGKGVASMMLEMRAGNPAEFLYRNHGFLPIGRPNYYRSTDGTRLDAITFRRDYHGKNLRNTDNS